MARRGVEIPTPDGEKARLAVLERRLQNPFGEPTAPIELKDKTRECRWFNAAIAADKIWRAKNKGWDPVTPDQVADLSQVGGYVLSPDGYITRGDRGQEVLMSMPKDWRRQIDLQKARHNNRNLGKSAAQKDEVVAAASQRLGDESASLLQKHLQPIGGVTDGYERIEQRQVEE